MILYGSSLSPFVRKVMAVAAEKGLVLDVRNTAPGSDDAEFRQASPLGKIPGFRDGEFTIADSTAIVTYLEAKFPERPMLPADPADRARTVWFEEFADTEMAPVVFKCFFQRIVAPLFNREPGDEAIAREGQTRDLPVVMDYLESVVPEPGAFLVGGVLTLADIAVASPFVNYAHAGCLPDKGAWPRTLAWVDSILGRPSFAPVIAREVALIARLRG
ncbi:MAG: glutathione S-transferase family protein [Sphingomonadales bacterium]|nr:glutathione S-transferase family protein [Sphingomonadales bacterium]